MRSSRLRCTPLRMTKRMRCLHCGRHDGTRMRFLEQRLRMTIGMAQDDIVAKDDKTDEILTTTLRSAQDDIMLYKKRAVVSALFYYSSITAAALVRLIKFNALLAATFDG